MKKDKLYIIDNIFSHAPSSSWYNHPEKFEWVRKIEDEIDDIIITDLNLIDYVKNKRVYGWLLESPEYTSNLYTFAKENFNKFEKIFTFDKELLGLSEKFIFIPLGGCWIEGSDRKIYDKCKLISMVYSNKQHLEGHKLRHKISSEIKNIDLYGSAINPIENKITALRDYKFSIVVENCKKDYYFSEKLIDCFITGTIPIYWGCPSIGKFFNENGILTFDTINDLKHIISKIDDNFYNERKNIIEENYEKSKKYLIAENNIYEKVKNGEYEKIN